ncbi:MAG: NAD(P)H-hydrate dehydratase [Anaerolineae bacterium]|nr:NAD(P)H-hydrate dehydratase [Anaerolineae bacterium]
MLKVISVEHMRAVESAADASGLSYDRMMENAGRALANRVIQLLAGRADARITVLVGPGNNGGDGLVAARIIAQETPAQVRCYLLKPRPDDDRNFVAAREARVFLAYAEPDRDGRVLRNMVASSDVLLDALYGIGVRLPLRADSARLLRAVNQALNDDQLPSDQAGRIITPDVPEPAPRLRPYVIAVDCPSGLDCNTGALDPNTIPADETLTFIAAKPGLFEFPGATAVGQLRVATIGISDRLPELQSEIRTLADGEAVSEMLPSRSANANKGTFGRALIVAGSTHYVGAAGLSAMAAYRGGVGLVTVASPAPVITALSGRLLEPTWLPLPSENGVLQPDAQSTLSEYFPRYDAALLGPGWGVHPGTRGLMERFLSTVPDSDAPSRWIIDADGLNLLASLPDALTRLPANAVLTPHPGEMSRLTNRTVAEVLSNRWPLTRDCAAAWNAVVVLKGAHTLITAPDGRQSVLPFKTDALATAGTGDVLAGLIVGFLAQGVEPFEASVTAGYLHGLAGVLAAERHGNTRSVIAGDVLDSIPVALSRLEA